MARANQVPDRRQRRWLDELRELGTATELTFHGDLEGHGIGKLMLGFVSSRVRASFPEVAQSIKDTTEANV